MDKEITSIAGVRRMPLRQIPTDGGTVLHMLRADSPFFSRFGEVYFSEITPGTIRAWKRHTVQTQCLAVPVGQVCFTLHDARENSSTCHATATCILGRPDHYALLHIPPMIWYGFACKSDTPALIVNCTDIPHQPEETQTLPLDGLSLPVCWGKRSGECDT